MFLFYIRVKVLFLPCKKASPRIVNRNTKMRNSRYLRDVPFEVKEQPMKLKSSKKRSKNLTKNSQKLKSSAQVKVHLTPNTISAKMQTLSCSKSDLTFFATSEIFSSNSTTGNLIRIVS